MPSRRPLSLVLVVLALGALAGCGSSQRSAPDLSTFQVPQGWQPASYLTGSLRFSAPTNWATQLGSTPLVVTFASGPAIIAIWSYPRSPTQVLPHDAASLRHARSALIAAAGARDPTFRVIAAAVIVHAGVRAVELDAIETIRGHVRRVRSTHIYQDGTELVIDEYAPATLFHAVDRMVFSPLLHSVRLARPGSP